MDIDGELQTGQPDVVVLMRGSLLPRSALILILSFSPQKHCGFRLIRSVRARTSKPRLFDGVASG